uniref:Uncharacterized protein n=1 Tax=Cacopsylla melanoneura TaxID=428564 RepID=A0A8D8U601_9HEMI
MQKCWCCCRDSCSEETHKVFCHKIKRNRVCCDGGRDDGSVVQRRKRLDQRDWKKIDRENRRPPLHESFEGKNQLNYSERQCCKCSSSIAVRRVGFSVLFVENKNVCSMFSYR